MKDRVRPIHPSFSQGVAMFPRNVVIRTAARLYRQVVLCLLFLKSQAKALFDWVLDRICIWLVRHYQTGMDFNF